MANKKDAPSPFPEVPEADDSNVEPQAFKSAEDLMEESTFSKRTEEDEMKIEDHARLQEEVEEIRHKMDPDYRAKSRAQFLGSMEVEDAWSPANRLKINRPNGDNNTYRFNYDKIRDRVGHENWKPVTDLAKAQEICPSSHLRVDADGRIYSGDSYLVTKPFEEVEQRNAMMYRRSKGIRKAALDGSAGQGGETFDSLHQRTASEDDPIGIRFSAKEVDEQI